MYVKNGTGLLKKVLMSPPTFLKPAPINEIAMKWKDTKLDVEKMLEEYQEILNVYRQNNIEIEYLQADERRPNSVFSRDFGACIKEGYILGKFKLPLRNKERTDYREKMKNLKIPEICTIEKGCFEGGDFMYLRDNLIAIGMADRTDLLGYEEMKEKLFPLGYEIVPVPVNKRYLHLDMCFNLVDDNLAVSYEAGLPNDFKKILRQNNIEIINVPEESIFEHGCNLQSLGNHKVLSLKQNSQVNEALTKKGIQVIEVNITEILKAGGGPHCMTFPLLRL